MLFSVAFYINSILLGVGLAMDAFSVSIANGIEEVDMKRSRRIKIAGCFGFFQFLMPVIGWFCVRSLVNIFTVAEPFIPVIAFVLLLFLGGKMILEELLSRDEEEEIEVTAGNVVSDRRLILQGIATSIDALSVGFTIESYTFFVALTAAIIIGAVTYVICLVGLRIGVRFGQLLAKRATVVGGLILIAIGFEILLTH